MIKRPRSGALMQTDCVIHTGLNAMNAGGHRHCPRSANLIINKTVSVEIERPLVRHCLSKHCVRLTASENCRRPETSTGVVTNHVRFPVRHPCNSACTTHEVVM